MGIITMLWMAWITGVVASAVLARRCVPLLEEASAESGSVPQEPSVNVNMTPHVVGLPMQEPTGSVVAVGATPGAEALATPSPDVPAITQGMPVQGMPVGN